MHKLIVLIGLICLLPKVELCYVEVVPSVAIPKNEYWEEMCRTVFPEFGKNILEPAKTKQKICYERGMVKPLMIIGPSESVPEENCRTNFKRQKCDENFFEDVIPCIEDGEMEIYQFVLELHAKMDNFMCNGSNISWQTAFLASNAYESMMLNQDKVIECHIGGHCAEISEGLLAHARGGSPDSFKSLYCTMLIDDALCIKGLFNYSGNDKAEKLYQELVKFTKELCSSYQGNGSNGNGTNGNGTNGNGSNGNGSNENGSNENGSNGIGSNENGSNGKESKGIGSNGNGSIGNVMNGNGSNRNVRKGNKSNGNESTGNESKGNGSAISMANYFVIAWLSLLTISKWV
ncbi:uncharacterized protein DDB_G0283357-like [Ischnura elegans]|uniref:uncharacterized protein DDB_G0283357-like n=1 Tax=Ischnura elegans TaxID=197161 RepID=UPI001ED87006|nr:uncharacterized protein DDB_G0283357-like [Ischnura elegans]